MKKIKYLCTGMVALHVKGEVLDGFLLAKFEDGRGLVYLPADRYDQTASISICEVADNDNWVNVSEEAYVNVDTKKQLDVLRQSLTNLNDPYVKGYARRAK
jgi:hypothetical protein